MRVFRIVLPLIIALGVGAAAGAATAPKIVMPNDVHWTAQPGHFSMATIYGDPSKAGFYVMRLKLPANWTFPVHYHPMQENITVLSGTLYAGVGNTIDKAKAMSFSAGSFVAMPARLHHYAFTRSQPAVIQIEGQGPSQDIMVKK